MTESMFQLPKSRWRRFGLFALAVVFVLAGINHFLNPDIYIAIMPPYLPAHRALVYVSGFFEILGGLAVLPRATRAAAGWGLVLLLLAIYPANVHMAFHPEQFAEAPAWALYARLPLQFVLMAWAYRATRSDAPASMIDRDSRG